MPEPKFKDRAALLAEIARVDVEIARFRGRIDISGPRCGPWRVVGTPADRIALRAAWKYRQRLSREL